VVAVDVGDAAGVEVVRLGELLAVLEAAWLSDVSLLHPTVTSNTAATAAARRKTLVLGSTDSD
jgi:hypothetical protein